MEKWNDKIICNARTTEPRGTNPTRVDRDNGLDSQASKKYPVSLAGQRANQEWKKEVASAMAYSRKVVSNQGDRVQLEIALASELYATWIATQNKVLTKERIEFIERRYSKGSVDRVKTYMNMIKNGELEWPFK